MTIQLSPDLLQGPIPGMSLTKEPGAYPWERPTQLTTVDEAVDFYAERLLNEKTEDSFLKAIDNAISGASGILIQFPLYFGIMGIMNHSGIVDKMSNFFVSISNFLLSLFKTWANLPSPPVITIFFFIKLNF